MQENFIFTAFLIFSGAAALSTVALLTRQSMMVAYILLGLCLGPFGLRWVDNPALVHNISEIGIVFLLFLLGMSLGPKSLIATFKKSLFVTLVSWLLFFAIAGGITTITGFPCPML